MTSPITTIPCSGSTGIRDKSGVIIHLVYVMICMNKFLSQNNDVGKSLNSGKLKGKFREHSLGDFLAYMKVDIYIMQISTKD